MRRPLLKSGSEGTVSIGSNGCVATVAPVPRSQISVRDRAAASRRPRLEDGHGQAPGPRVEQEEIPAGGEDADGHARARVETGDDLGAHRLEGLQVPELDGDLLASLACGPRGPGDRPRHRGRSGCCTSRTGRRWRSRSAASRRSRPARHAAPSLWITRLDAGPGHRDQGRATVRAELDPIERPDREFPPVHGPEGRGGGQVEGTEGRGPVPPRRRPGGSAGRGSRGSAGPTNAAWGSRAGVSQSRMGNVPTSRRSRTSTTAQTLVRRAGKSEGTGGPTAGAGAASRRGAGSGRRR